MASFTDQSDMSGLEHAPFVHDKHVTFLKALQDKVDTFEYCVTEHLRMSAVYWTMTAFVLLGLFVFSLKFSLSLSLFEVY